MTSWLPYGQHELDDDDRRMVMDVMSAGRMLSNGPEVDAFEADLSSILSDADCAAVNSGTAALHLACLAAGLEEGDLAIVPAITFVATANVVRMCGADVFFCDTDPLTGNMTPDTFERAIQACRANGTLARVKAVLPVHMGGHLVDIPAIIKIARRYRMTVITDSCHALGGVHPDGVLAGSCVHEDIATFSFHPVKTIAMGEAGAVVSRSAEIMGRIRRLRSHDLVRQREGWQNPPTGEAPWYYETHELGYNYRVSDILCALGRSQLRKLDRFLVKRRLLADYYEALLMEHAIPGVRLVPKPAGQSGWHLFRVLIDFEQIGYTRGHVMTHLSELDVGSQVHYIPVSSQPYYQKLYGVQSLPGAEAYYTRTLSLPLFPAMAESDVERVVAALRAATS